MNRRAAALLATAMAAAPALDAYTFLPPYDGLRVRVERFETAGFPRVEMFFRVQSGHKQDFRNLHEANVRLIEEEVPIRDLQVQLEEPALSLALVLDDSGSIDPELEYLKLAATRFVEELHRLDEVAVISFDRGAKVSQDRTTRKDRVKEAIGKLRGYGATALFDGAMLGVDATAGGKGQRKMLLLTDGNDQVYYGGRPLSVETVESLIGRAKAEGVEIYTIALGKNANVGLLERLAQRTGGQSWYAPHPRHLREVFDAIVRSMTARFRVSFVSPNSRREKLDRTVTLDVDYQGHVGQGVGTYWLDKEVPVQRVAVQRKTVAGKGPGMMRLYTQGFQGQHLLTEFTLRGADGRIYRQGRTTLDGFGRLDTPDPVLADLAPGKYDLELKVGHEPLRFKVPGLEVRAGEITTRAVAFTRLIFTRDGEPWYELQHPYGETSELIEVTIRDAIPAERDATGPTEPLFRGPLANLRSHRELGVWLPEGVYDVGLANLWKDEDPAARAGEGAPLLNQLDARFQVLGGQELRFDVQREDLAGEVDVLSPDWLAQHADEDPFLRLKPETHQQLADAVAHKRDRYLAGEFTRHDRGHLSETSMYRYRDPDEIAARLVELEERYRGDEPADVQPDVDAYYRQDHGLGPEQVAQRMKEIEGHYLTTDERSFPDRAGATPRYTGGPGDRFQGVGDLRRDHDARGSLNRPEAIQDLLNAMRERVGASERTPKPSDLGGVDPTDPQGPGDLDGLAKRVRSRLRDEQHRFPDKPHNMDGKN